MIIRTIRDIFTGEVDSIYIDEPAAYERAKEFLQIVMPRYVNRLQLFEGKEPLFHKYKLDEEIARINQRQVLCAGGDRWLSIRLKRWWRSMLTVEASEPTAPPRNQRFSLISLREGDRSTVAAS